MFDSLKTFTDRVLGRGSAAITERPLAPIAVPCPGC